MLDTKSLLLESDFPELRRAGVDTLQANLGYLCNLSCSHCHVNAGPKRTEVMSEEVAGTVLRFVERQRVQTLDLTGGAPELNPNFRMLVVGAADMGVQVIDRCNLTVLEETGYEWVAEFLARNRVQVVASLPCYSEENVRQQRGNGVFEASIRGLQLLNSLGYGRGGGLQLDLVYNPNGTFLPPPQEPLEQKYKQILKQHFDLSFDSLYTITNMPINRYGSMLLSKGLYAEYMQLLKDNFDRSNLPGVMCRQMLSVDWRGYLYDCDFNQMLDLPANLPDGDDIIARSGTHRRLGDYLDHDFQDSPIMVGEHCYGCTAGQGSSCGGALN